MNSRIDYELDEFPDGYFIQVTAAGSGGANNTVEMSLEISSMDQRCCTTFVDTFLNPRKLWGTADLRWARLASDEFIADTVIN